jgi:ribosome-binding protein aMBF1 (putative translation factor)
MDDLDRFLQKQLQSPEFAKEFERLRPQYEVISDVLHARARLGLSQEELAQKMGKQQPAISRFEGASVMPSIGFLQELAEALDMKLVVRLEAKDAPVSPLPASATEPAVGRRRAKKVSSTSNAR